MYYLSMEDYEIITTIKKIRINKKINQQEMADFLRISQQSYSDLEQAKTKLTLIDFLKICKKLDIDPITIVSDSNSIIISLSPEEIDVLNHLHDKISNQFQIKNIKIKTSGDVIIGNNINNSKK